MLSKVKDMGLFKNIGPGALVAAAFIGPGTVTACTLAGANFGYALVWVLLFSVFATIILQEMSARLGIITQKGLGENLRDAFDHSIWKWPLFFLIIVALYLGNAAYEAGNLSGAALGIEAVIGHDPVIYKIAVGVIFLTAAVSLWFSSYKRLEKMLIGLVVLMAISFLITFIMVKPDLTALFNGMLIPEIPESGLMTVIALIGTTVVPYNLFLHASAVKSHWKTEKDLSHARSDTALSIGLGGLIMISITGTAAASIFGTGLVIGGAGDMAKQLEPLFGSNAVYFLGAGFFAAGLSSSITAPLATAYAISEILNIKGGLNSLKFRLISLSVVITGALLALTGIKPITIILSAQFANGLLLPIIVVFLLLAMNKKNILGKYSNGIMANILGGAVLLITSGLGVRLILKSLNLM